MKCSSGEQDNKRPPTAKLSALFSSLAPAIPADAESRVAAAVVEDGRALVQQRSTAHQKDTTFGDHAAAHEQRRRQRQREASAAASCGSCDQPWRQRGVGASSQRIPQQLPSPDGRDEEKKKGRPQSEHNLFPLRRHSDQTRKNEGNKLKLSAGRRWSGSSVIAQLPPPSYSPSAPAARTSSSATASTFFGSCDDNRYWDYAFRLTNKGDMGHLCRECKRPFSELNKVMAVRRGGRIELRYHECCFSMKADPRSQPASSANMGKFVESLKGTEAPQEMYRKMRTRGHW